MYDEVMQLIALAKNDEKYFQRIEELKAKQMELAQVMEIAKTLGEADKHMAMSRQSGDEIVAKATAEAKQIKTDAELYVADTKATLLKAKEKKAALDKREEELYNAQQALKEKEDEMNKVIAEHRHLTALRTEEAEAANKVKVNFERKLAAMREIANS